MFKLNPELFKDCKSDFEVVGDLGYPAILQNFIFNEVGRAIDEVRGEIVSCIIQPPKGTINGQSYVATGKLKLLAKDLIPA